MGGRQSRGVRADGAAAGADASAGSRERGDGTVATAVTIAAAAVHAATTVSLYRVVS